MENKFSKRLLATFRQQIEIIFSTLVDFTDTQSAHASAFEKGNTCVLGVVITLHFLHIFVIFLNMGSLTFHVKPLSIILHKKIQATT